ncbi:NRDE-2, necessary for RNA interference-domain-containing protein [Microdochium bolleyi]|uniref:NRDE-2, necessary for RNA interference-domain-containing protein n=1 Tax=Microdochium bolleyi TaxID=196109 RepID=A0A136JKP8_9PEZI|nr:NRDE-2, necessary for RNA interference-domain-containing protein [Microdochium bolleyi]
MPREEARPRQTGSKPVPKFSFKARTEAPAPLPDTSATQHDEKPPAVHGDAGRTQEPAPARSAHPQQLPARNRHPEDGFTVDKRGDPLIRQYGSNNTREVPGYRRYGSGRVLGADGFIRFERTGTRNEFFFRGYRDKGPILSTDRKTFRAMSGLAGGRPVRVRPARGFVTSAGDEYLPLTTSRNSHIDNGSALASGTAEGDLPAYRSLHSQGDSEDEDMLNDDDHQSRASDSDMQDCDHDPITKRSIELGRKVRDTPHDMDAWHALVDHQDILLLRTARDALHPTPAEVRSFADIKLSLLEKALSHAASPEQRELIQLKLMAEGMKLWDDKTTERRWDEVLELYPSSQSLWEAQMAYRQANITTFRHDDIKQRYILHLKDLHKNLQVTTAGQRQEDLCNELICTFLHATTFLSDAGYMELACSAWQAVLELTFCRPTSSTLGEHAALFMLFQEFWDSEVPRFGEAGSMGWANFAKDHSQSEPPEPHQLKAWSPPPTRDAYKAWAATERWKSKGAAISARTLDEGAEDDPFRVVLFPDIEDLLLWIPSSAISNVKALLVNAFLRFCCLPAALETSSTKNWTSKWPSRSSTGCSLGMLSKDQAGLGNSEEAGRRGPDFEQCFQNFARTPQALFHGSDWLNYFEVAKDSEVQARQLWAVEVLKQLVLRLSEAELAPYYFALNGTLASGDDKKTAKALLKRDPTNVDLYIGYSTREYSAGNAPSARNIASAALGLPNLPEHDRLRLVAWLAGMRIESQELEEAAKEIIAYSQPMGGTHYPAGQPQDFTGISELRQSMRSKRDFSVSAGNLGLAFACTKVLVLLEYLTAGSNKEPASEQQGDIWSALRSADELSDDLKQRGVADSSEHEELLEFSSKLLYFHATHGPCRLGLLREQFAKYIDYFPMNTTFQVLFAWRETRLSIDDHVRSKLDELVADPKLDCISTRAFVIQHEARVGNANSTAAAFEHALNSNPCKNHPQIWIAYIRFCYKHTSLRRKAKSVLYRALQRCPWSKDVYMEAFATLVSEFDSSELKSVYNTMVEKGLRIHTEMDDFVQEWKAQQREKRQRQ